MKTEDNGPEIERVILGLLEARAEGASICPSEAARAAFPEDWRDHMDEVREVAVRLAAEGVIAITQGGKAVDGPHVKGPIRLRLQSGKSRAGR